MLTDHAKVGDIKIAWVGKGMGRPVTRSDLTDFLVQQIEDQTSSKKQQSLVQESIHLASVHCDSSTCLEKSQEKKPGEG
jgi:hypothetical protein